MATVERTPREIAELADALYRRSIEPLVCQEHQGRLLIIDTDSGEYVIGDDEVALTHEAQKRFPLANSFLMRIGHRAAHRLGAVARLAEAP